MREVPAGYRDYLVELRKHSDAVLSTPPILAAAADAVDGTSYEEWGRLAQTMAGMYDLRRGDRVLIDAAEHEHPVKWLLAPLAAGASVVLCANLDPATVTTRVALERVTRVL